MSASSRQPKQARSRETYERLLGMAQQMLEEDGIESFSSNLLVERLGMTPPAFYRYFANKHALLRELGQRLMEQQNTLLDGFGPASPSAAAGAGFLEETEQTLKATLEVTRSFTGGYALLVSLRAIPELRPVRLESHQAMAQVVARRLKDLGATDRPAALLARARLAIEIGYGAVEMLFETDFKNERVVIAGAARAIAATLEVD